jgi:hypothetical protein
MICALVDHLAGRLYLNTVGWTSIMDTFEWVIMTSALVITLGPGLAALTTAWLFPWLRESIARPRLWGIGEMIFGLFFIMQLLNQTVVTGAGSDDLLFYTGLAFALIGCIVMALARHPAKRT